MTGKETYKIEYALFGVKLEEEVTGIHKLFIRLDWLRENLGIDKCMATIVVTD